MSATRPSGPSRERQSADAERETSRGRPVPRDISRLHVRRREANRRRRLLRLDLGIGVLAALVLLIATPGLAIAALFAGLLVAACVASIVLERRRRRPAASRPAQRRRSPTRPGAGDPAVAERGTTDASRSARR